MVDIRITGVVQATTIDVTLRTDMIDPSIDRNFTVMEKKDFSNDREEEIFHEIKEMENSRTALDTFAQTNSLDVVATTVPGGVSTTWSNYFWGSASGSVAL